MGQRFFSIVTKLVLTNKIVSKFNFITFFLVICLFGFSHLHALEKEETGHAFLQYKDFNIHLGMNKGELFSLLKTESYFLTNFTSKSWIKDLNNNMIIGWLSFIIEILVEAELDYFCSSYQQFSQDSYLFESVHDNNNAEEVKSVTLIYDNGKIEAQLLDFERKCACKISDSAEKFRIIKKMSINQ